MTSHATSSLRYFAKKLGLIRTRCNQTTRAKRRALRLELLEARQVMTGDIAGTVFNDANANGVAESTETDCLDGPFLSTPMRTPSRTLASRLR